MNLRRIESDLPVYRTIWRRNWAHVILFFDYPPESKKAIYTTKEIDSVNRGMRNVTKYWLGPKR